MGETLIWKLLNNIQLQLLISFLLKMIILNENINSLAARFFIPFAGHGVNFLQTFTWHGLLALVFMISGLRIEAPPPSTVQGKCIYTFLKAENQ